MSASRVADGKTGLTPAPCLDCVTLQRKKDGTASMVTATFILYQKSYVQQINILTYLHLFLPVSKTVLSL